MKQLAAGLILTLASTALGEGKATGSLLVGDQKKPLTHAYALEKSKLVRVILSSGPLDDEALTDRDALQERVGSGICEVV